MKTTKGAAIRVGVFVGLLPLPALAEEPGAVVDAVLRAYGGWEKLQTVASYRMEGSVLTTHQRPPASMYRVFARPDRLKVVVEYSDKREVRIIDGTRGLRTNDQRVLVPATGVMLDSMALQLARAAVPWILAEKRGVLRRAEPLVAADAKGLVGVELPLAPGLTLRAYADPRTHLIARVLTVLDRPEMQTVFEARYSDYREVHGVRFAFREENFAAGTHAASTAIRSVVLNPQLAQEEFRR